MVGTAANASYVAHREIRTVAQLQGGSYRQVQRLDVGAEVADLKPTSRDAVGGLQRGESVGVEIERVEVLAAARFVETNENEKIRPAMARLLDCSQLDGIISEAKK